MYLKDVVLFFVYLFGKYICVVVQNWNKDYDNINLEDLDLFKKVESKGIRWLGENDCEGGGLIDVDVQKSVVEE